MKDINFPSSFLFGVSNASTQVEDELDCPWLKFGNEGKIRSFLNSANPEQKIRFWSHPEEEIKWAEELGVQVFRMSVDWQRLCPDKPGHTVHTGVQNREALKRYRDIIKMIKEAGMQVMLTLFHHSQPQWAYDEGGWTHSWVADQFVAFSQDVITQLDPLVDYWNTFNEPNVFAFFTHVVGNWPPGKANPLAPLYIPNLYRGDFFRALDLMSEAHNRIYTIAHKINPQMKIGIAHNIAYYRKAHATSFLSVKWSWKYMNYYFPDKVKEHLDFMGVNYYGPEYISLKGVHFQNGVEYNDAGRAIDPKGLYQLLIDFSKRYKLPLFITENGTADEKDLFRSAYICEHLSAVRSAMNSGVEVLGYILWTLSDNFEWSDGYGPKFGLIEVNRTTMERRPRQSFYTYQSIIKKKCLPKQLRKECWFAYQCKIGQLRPLYRAKDGLKGLDRPRHIPLTKADWRFSEIHK